MRGVREWICVNRLRKRDQICVTPRPNMRVTIAKTLMSRLQSYPQLRVNMRGRQRRFGSRLRFGKASTSGSAGSK